MYLHDAEGSTRTPGGKTEANREPRQNSNKKKTRGDPFCRIPHSTRALCLWTHVFTRELFPRQGIRIGMPLPPSGGVQLFARRFGADPTGVHMSIAIIHIGIVSTTTSIIMIIVIMLMIIIIIILIVIIIIRHKLGYPFTWITPQERDARKRQTNNKP